MLCRTARVPKRVTHRPLRCRRSPYFPRSNSTSASSSGVKTVPNNSSQERGGEKQHARFGNRYPSTRTANIRFWEPVHSIADVWVVKRALEKKYGAILETYFHKDFETPDRYQLIAFVIFRDPEALKRIPEAGEEFTVLAPEIPNKPIHEISINDIEAYAGNHEFQPDFQFDQPEENTSERIIGGNIRHSPIEYCSNPEHRKFFQATAQRTMAFFLNWGGFNPVKLDMSQPVFHSDLFKPGAREENARMKAALQICSRVTSPLTLHGVAPTVTIPEDQTLTSRPSSARLFAGLYDKMPTPAMGRLRKGEVDGVDCVVEESVASSSSATPTPTSKDSPSDTRGPTLKKKESEPANSSPPPSEGSVFTSIPTSQPIRRPQISLEEKRKLESQLYAARLLQKATTPVRRKQLKPVTVPAKKSKPQSPILDSNQADEAFVAEEKPEKESFLAKLVSLFRR